MKGSCLCGAVTVTVRGHAPTGASACHCDPCRTWTGAALWGISAPAGAVEVTGVVAQYRSSRFATRAFCGTCGTHLWIRDDDGDYDLLPGLFPDARDLPLSHEVYADRAMACVALSGDHRRVSAREYERQHRHEPEACG